MVTRRTFLLGGIGTAVVAVIGGYAAIEEDVLPGRIRLAQLTGQCDVDATPPPSTATIVSGRFSSSARKTDVGWSLVTPPGVSATGLPVVVVLHGRNNDHTSAFAELRLQDFLAAAVQAGTEPFALASVDGGSNTYWHPRSDGDNPIAMLTDEFLPLLRKRGLSTERIGTLGWSMGGFGSLLLPRESHRGNLGDARVVAAAAGSPALFASYKASASGAFDNAADFEEYGEIASTPDVGGVALHVCCGADDAFTDETRRYRRNVSPTPAGGIDKGCHTDGYWRSQAAAQLAFLGAHLG